jgi:hypothetical protein
VPSRSALDWAFSQGRRHRNAPPRHLSTARGKHPEQDAPAILFAREENEENGEDSESDDFEDGDGADPARPLRAAAAGEIMAEGGEVRAISDRSGHFQPGTDQTLQFVGTLQDAGVNLDNT